MAGGPLGALAGYLVGTLFDTMLSGGEAPTHRSYQDYSQYYQQAYRQRH